MPCYSTATWMPNYDKFHNVDSKTDLQGAPIPWEKFITSVTVTDFFTKFTAFTEKDSCHIRSKFRHNNCNGFKTRNEWESLAYIPLGAAMSPPSK